MSWFEKLPVRVEAVQWTGFNIQEMTDHMGEKDILDLPVYGGELIITTLEGDMTARVGDWIVRGIKGELYPVKDPIFRETYKAVRREQYSAGGPYSASA